MIRRIYLKIPKKLENQLLKILIFDKSFDICVYDFLFIFKINIFQIFKKLKFNIYI